MPAETTTLVTCDAAGCDQSGVLTQQWRAQAEKDGWSIRVGLIPRLGWYLCPEHAPRTSRDDR